MICIVFLFQEGMIWSIDREYIKLPQMLFHEKIWSYPSQMNQSSFQALNRFFVTFFDRQKMNFEIPLFSGRRWLWRHWWLHRIPFFLSLLRHFRTGIILKFSWYSNAEFWFFKNCVWNCVVCWKCCLVENWRKITFQQKEVFCRHF